MVTTPAESPTFYDQIGGEPTFRTLGDEFYAGVAPDPVLRPLYPPADPPPRRGTAGRRVPRTDRHASAVLRRLGHPPLPGLLRRYVSRSAGAPNGRRPARSRYSRHHTGRVPMTHAGQQDRPYDGQ